MSVSIQTYGECSKGSGDGSAKNVIWYVKNADKGRMTSKNEKDLI